MISSTQKSHILTAIGAAVLSAAITTQASLIQWLTVTNVSTLETDDTGRVINWLDSSGSDNDTINAGGIIGNPLYPSDSLAASGIPGVDLGTNRNGFRLWTTTAQDTWLDFTGAASGKSGFAVLVAFKIDANASSSSRNTVIANHGNPAGNPSFVLKYETGYPACYLGSGANNTQYINTSPSAALQAGDTVVFAFNYSAATGFWELWDSKSGGRMTSTAAANGNFSSAQTMYLGTSENDGQWFSGDVFEVKIYDNVLTATELTDRFNQRRFDPAPRCHRVRLGQQCVRPGGHMVGSDHQRQQRHADHRHRSWHSALSECQPVRLRQGRGGFGHQ